MDDEIPSPEGLALEDIRKAILSYGAAIQDVMIELAALRMTLVEKGLVSDADLEKSKALIRTRIKRPN